MNISNILQKWYAANKRNLPWRQTKNPYYIWISEVILQQTRVAQGISYYLNFIKKYPTVKLLANASEKDVLNLWQGLGYYSRARNMLYASKQILEKFNGKIPDNYSQIIEIKGIGKYTASAILSIAYDKPYPVVDGNVLRVLSRLYGYAKPVNINAGYNDIYKIAAKLIDKKNPGNHNQAIMEFGALICSPVPYCENCILKLICVAYKNKIIDKIPVKTKKAKQKIRYFNYFFVQNKNSFYIRKRNFKDIWENMYDFPLIETKKKELLINIINSDKWYEIFQQIKPKKIKYINSIVHILTHQKIKTTFYNVQIEHELIDTNNAYIKITKKEIKNFPFPNLINQFFNTQFFN
ncbi:MAG: A/G-specific adenine glycosylase [Chlorobi bacterium]|nr:A/G-specific adenine glycosylase [Chlorobiota bacterium]